MADKHTFPVYVDESKLVKDGRRMGHWVYPPTGDVFACGPEYQPPVSTGEVTELQLVPKTEAVTTEPAQPSTQTEPETNGGEGADTKQPATTEPTKAETEPEKAEKPAKAKPVRTMPTKAAQKKAEGEPKTEAVTTEPAQPSTQTEPETNGGE